MYRLMLVRFNRDSGEFEDQEFNRFCREYNIVRIEKEFINIEGNIYYSFFIEYQDRRGKQNKPDLESLNDKERAQYERLREWRNDIASSEGIPAYILMYNSQLIDIVKRQPSSIGDFSSIKGMQAKAGKYGEAIIKILQETSLSHEE